MRKFVTLFLVAILIATAIILYMVDYRRRKAHEATLDSYEVLLDEMLEDSYASVARSHMLLTAYLVNQERSERTYNRYQKILLEHPEWVEGVVCNPPDSSEKRKRRKELAELTAHMLIVLRAEMTRPVNPRLEELIKAEYELANMGAWESLEKMWKRYD
ncbi:MAG: hypothetical protein IJV69_06805 [Kiritimatiellae bacterium]|nr:hypothetical protein [Kiritimatiellia bacterium]